MSDCSTEAFKPHARMEKSKRQLRAEAVERLRKLNCMDVDCYQLLEAVVDDAGEKVGYRVEIRKLIDLLTDEPTNGIEGETNGIADGSPLVDRDPVEIMRNCGGMEHGMGSLRKMLGIECVSGWQMRCLRKLADMVERDYVRRDKHEQRVAELNGAICERDGRIGSYERRNTELNDALKAICKRFDVSTEWNAEDAAKKVLEAIDELQRQLDTMRDVTREFRDERDEWKSQAESHGDAQRSVLSADADTDKGDGAKDNQDSRERLEADIKKYRWEHGETSGRVTEWLDRQAAITERHWMEICGASASANVELNRQNDELRLKVRRQGKQLAELQDAIRKRNEGVLKDSWKKQLAELKAERDMYRDKLGRAIDAAHKITRLKED